MPDKKLIDYLYKSLLFILIKHLAAQKLPLKYTLEKINILATFFMVVSLNFIHARSEFVVVKFVISI